MAKLVNPLLSQDARGSVSGVQFSRNRSGNFGSRKSTSTRSQAPGALEFRAVIGAAHHAFDNLSIEEKDSWAASAPPGRTGRNHYVAAYLVDFTLGQTPDDSFPENIRLGSIDSILLIPPIPPAIQWSLFWTAAGDTTTRLRVRHHPSWSPFPSLHDRKWRVVATTENGRMWLVFDQPAEPPYHQFLFEIFDHHRGQRVWWGRVDDDPVIPGPFRLAAAWTRWSKDQKQIYRDVRKAHPAAALPAPPEEPTP